MYLAGFSLTLVFVIARLVELMQQNVNAEEEKEALVQRLKHVGDAAERAGIETDISSTKTEDSTLRKRSGTATEGKKDD